VTARCESDRPDGGVCLQKLSAAGRCQCTAHDECWSCYQDRNLASPPVYPAIF